MQKIVFALFLVLPIAAFNIQSSFGLPAESVEIVTDKEYFPVAQKLIKEAKTSIRVMMFEMGYYEDRSTTPSNLLIKALIDAKKRGVKVEVILEVREDADRTSKRNR